MHIYHMYMCLKVSRKHFKLQHRLTMPIGHDCVSSDNNEFKNEGTFFCATLNNFFLKLVAIAVSMRD